MSDLPLPLVSPLSASPGPMKKKPWQSKTNWANVIIATLTLIPGPVHDFVTRYPIAVTMGVTGINVLMRHFTHGKISLED